MPRSPNLNHEASCRRRQFEKFKDRVTVEATTAAAKPETADAVDEANPPEPAGRIDLNSATADELEVLPGIGPVKAKAIVEGRPYASLADFESKGIVAKSTFDKFSDAIEVVPVAKASGGATTAASGKQLTAGQIAARKRIKMCGAQWRAEKAAGDIRAGQTWPQYWRQVQHRPQEAGLLRRQGARSKAVPKPAWRRAEPACEPFAALSMRAR